MAGFVQHFLECNIAKFCYSSLDQRSPNRSSWRATVLSWV